MLPSVAQQEAQIRGYAASIGIDPDIAVQVARSEGLAPNTWQSNVQQPYGREQSYGAFQLHVDPTGKRPGLGNEFVAKTGLDPTDPTNWEAMNKFALDQARQQGWGPWMGAKAAGITGMMGIGQPPVPSPSPTQGAAAPSMGTSMGGYAMGPAAVQERMDTGQVMGLLDEETKPMISEDTWKAIGKVGQSLQDASAAPQEQFEWLQPQVLQPRRQFTLALGKGLLG